MVKPHPHKSVPKNEVMNSGGLLNSSPHGGCVQDALCHYMTWVISLQLDREELIVQFPGLHLCPFEVVTGHTLVSPHTCTYLNPSCGENRVRTEYF